MNRTNRSIRRSSRRTPSSIDAAHAPIGHQPKWRNSAPVLIGAILATISGCATRQHAVFVPDTRDGRACLQKCLDSSNLCLGSAEGFGKLIVQSRCKEQLQRCALDCPNAFRNPEGELCAAGCEGTLCAHCPLRAELDATGKAARVGLNGEAADAAAAKAMATLSNERAAESSP